MDEAQVGRLLGEEYCSPSCGLIECGMIDQSHLVITEREYWPGEIGVIFETTTDGTPRVLKVFSVSLLGIWSDVRCSVTGDWLKGLPHPVAEVVEKGTSACERVIFDAPPK
jgi:hypothetical protein